MNVPGFPTSRRPYGGARSPGRAAVAAAILIAFVAIAPAATPVLALPTDGPIVGQAVQHDVSPPLRDLAPAPATTDGHGPPRDLLEARPTHAHGPVAAVADPVVQGSIGPASAPSTSANFAGVSNLDGVYPPDTNGDVGPNHYVQWVNLHFAIYSKTGAVLYGPVPGNTLWSGFGGPCQAQNSGDPIALYDSIADRWIMGQFTSSSPYGECVAVSTSGDPTGTWNRYFFQFSTSTFYDYPKLGVWPDGYYLTANRFGGLFGGFQGASAIVLDRSAMLAGRAASFQQFNTSTSYGSLLPADLDGRTLPPAGAAEPVAEIGTSALHLWKLHVDWATPTNSSLAGPSSLPVAAYNELCPSTRSCVAQPGTTVGLDGLGDRLMYRLSYRNFGDHESLLVDHSVNVASSGTQAGVRWYEVRGVTTTPSLFQQGTFAPDTTNRWMASIAMDGSGGIGVGYSVSSGSVFPGIRVTGRLASDPPGQLTQGETTIIAGSGVQTGSASRWGDYSSMSIDPVDDCTFWYTTEYMPTTGGAPWQTRIASFRLAGCGGGSTATVPGAPAGLAATGGQNTVHLSWTAPASDGGSAILGYRVYRGTASGTETLLTSIANVTSWDDSVAAGTYWYEVSAVNSVGEGGLSNEATATATAPPGATVPGAPQALVAAAANGKGVQLSWAAPATDGGSAITGYRIYRGTASGGEALLASAGVVTGFKDTSTRRGTRYYYEVTAVNSIGVGAFSNEASAVAK